MKLGLGESYDRVEYIPQKLRAYLDLTKPASSVGVAGGFFIASLLYFYHMRSPQTIVEQPFSIIYASFTLLLAHGASQAMNMAEDAEMDMETEHKQNRPIPSGVVSVEEARTISWLMAGGALVRGFMVSNTFGLFVSVLMFFGVFYNLDPIRAKERIISIPWQACSRGLLMFPTVWAAYGNPYRPLPWVLGAFTFLYVMGFQNSADIIDKEVDEKHGIRTFVVEFGVRRTVLIAFGCAMGMMAVLAVGVATGVVPVEYTIMALMLPVCMKMCVDMWENPHEVSEKTGNHPAWLHFYGGMVMCVTLPLVPELLQYHM